MKFDFLTVAEECYNNLQFRDDFLFCKILTERTGSGQTVLAKKIQEEVEKARTHDEWRREFMTLYMRDQEKLDEGMAVGLETGMARGLETGMAQGFEKAHIEMAKRLIQTGQEKEYILTLGITEEEYENAAEIGNVR